MLRLTHTFVDNPHRSAAAGFAANEFAAEQRSHFGGGSRSYGMSAPPCAASTPAPSPLVTNLARFGYLAADEIDGLTALSRNPRRLRAEQIMIHEGRRTDYICLVVRGFACRYKLLANGRRQILAYLIPGDLCDVQFSLCNRPDHSVVCLTDSEVVRIPLHAVDSLVARFPSIARALSLAVLRDNAILREWLLNVGQRSAIQRLCHLFCELSVRLDAIGQVAPDGSFELPVVQTALADTTGLTPVHINRTLQRLRSDGLISLRQRRLTILDAGRLRDLAGFDESYLDVQGQAA